MPKTDTSEAGLERLICTALTGAPCDPPKPGQPTEIAEAPPAYGGAGWICGDPRHYDREFCVDLTQLGAYLRATQPEVVEALDLDDSSPTRQKFLARLQGEISRRGTIDVLRHGLKHGPHDLDLFYGTPSPDNPAAIERYAANRFSVTRQLRYSRDETRAVVHFAVDEHEVRFCTHLKGKASWFLPFNQGWNDGAGNPPNALGLKTDYLWRRILTRERLTDILENYAQVIKTRDKTSKKKKPVQIWPRYHQLDVVRQLLRHIAAKGVGRQVIVATGCDHRSYYKLVKKVEHDPEFDTKRAKKKLRRYVESHDHAIRLKAEIMVDHFHEQVLARGMIGGEARAMVVTSGIERAIQYYHAISAYLEERKSPHRAIVAFSGEHEYGGAKVTEASLNGFPSSKIADTFQEHPYRFLVCADKF